MNKEPVPVFSKGPNKSFIIAHKDLDGCNAVQVCYRWLKENCGENHQIEYRGATYEYINTLAENIFNEFQEYRYILIGDISISEELLAKIPPNCFIFDHHDTSKYLEEHPQCYWKEGWCGSVVAWKSLFPGIKPTPAFGKLLSLCNSYDMWHLDGDTGFPIQEAMDLDVLQRKYGYNEFFTKFYDGFTGFDDIDRRTIERHWVEQKEAIENTEVMSYNEDVCMIIFQDQRLDPNYYCTRLLNEGWKAVLVFYTGANRLSVRINSILKDKFHAGYFLKAHIQNNNNSKGGHELAAGCSVEGMTVDQILDVGNILVEELNKIKGISKAQ